MAVEEWVVISGKGGTGKTSITASLAVLDGATAIADCDVDAPDLHLVLAPDVQEEWVFYSGEEAVLQPNLCNGCGLCAKLCRFDAIQSTGNGGIRIDPLSCEGCRVCVQFCPRGAITMHERRSGVVKKATSTVGPMVYAQLDAGGENSGKLVAEVRKQVKKLAEAQGYDRILIDGPPGIGCPVAATITGVQHVLVVTEPTVSGLHDLERVLGLTQHFKVSASLCINKWDLYPEMSRRIEAYAAEMDIPVVGRIRYDNNVTAAQRNGTAVVYVDTPASNDIEAMWFQLKS